MPNWFTVLIRRETTVRAGPVAKSRHITCQIELCSRPRTQGGRYWKSPRSRNLPALFFFRSAWRTTQYPRHCPIRIHTRTDEPTNRDSGPIFSQVCIPFPPSPPRPLPRKAVGYTPLKEGKNSGYLPSFVGSCYSSTRPRLQKALQHWACVFMAPLLAPGEHRQSKRGGRRTAKKTQ